MSKLLHCILYTILISTLYSETIIPMTKQTGTLASTVTKSTTTNTSTITQQQLGIKLERSPVYAYPGIICDFIVSPAIQRTQDQIQNLFQYEFSDNKYLPPRMYISRGDRNDQIRVLFDYQNDIPFRPFSVKFKIFDQKNVVLGAASISIVFDSISGGITSALHMDEGVQDFLR